MYLLYSFLLVFWGLLLLPAFLIKAWRRGTYLPGMSERFGRLPESLRHNGRATLWFHSCSVGETISLQPLVQILSRRFPEARFVFSTITQTGQQIARQRFAMYGAGNTFYFPIDLAFIARRVLDWIQPAMIVIIDTEIWPNALHQAHSRGIPVILVNGRISSASFRHYRWFRSILSRVFRNYSALLMQSEEDARRIAQVGAPADKIAVMGNIKIDRDSMADTFSDAQVRELRQFLDAGKSSMPLIVAGSTHPGEEEILLEALGRIRREQGFEHTRMLLAPRHPERFDAVALLAERRGFKPCRRTRGSEADKGGGILILDTVGELAAAYQFATIAFIGGTLIPHGGHSIMEPALFSKAIVTGPSMENFRQIAQEFRARAAICQITAGSDNGPLQVQQLLDVFLRLLQNSKERERMGKAAFSILEQNQGTTQRVAERIAVAFEEARK
jgi:3-deoxy-D-manno-octulosonic-acid transferase